MADRPRKVVDIFIDKKYTLDQRQRIAEEAIRYIKSRTAKGKGKDNKPFKQDLKYSKGRANPRTYADSYRDSNEFKTAGKSPSPINLRLTGDTMDSLEVVDVSLQGRVRIGYDSAGDESDKAWFNEEKGYNFLDLSKKESEAIQRRAGGVSTAQTEAISRELADQIARNLFDNE